jgi:hypothetical protein
MSSKLVQAPRTYWNLDVTQKAMYFLTDHILNLESNVIGSHIRTTGVKKLRGEAYIVFDGDDPVDFVSNFVFDYHFTVSIGGASDVAVQLVLTDEIMRNIQTIDPTIFNYSWKGNPAPFLLHQAKAVFQSQRCRTVIKSVYFEYIKYCHMQFLHYDSFGSELEGSESLEGVYQIQDASAGNGGEDDEEPNFDV